MFISSSSGRQLDNRRSGMNPPSTKEAIPDVADFQSMDEGIAAL